MRTYDIISYVEWGSARDLVIHTYVFLFFVSVRNAMDDSIFSIPFYSMFWITFHCICSLTAIVVSCMDDTKCVRMILLAM